MAGPDGKEIKKDKTIGRAGRGRIVGVKIPTGRDGKIRWCFLFRRDGTVHIHFSRRDEKVDIIFHDGPGR